MASFSALARSHTVQIYQTENEQQGCLMAAAWHDLLLTNALSRFWWPRGVTYVLPARAEALLRRSERLITSSLCPVESNATALHVVLHMRTTGDDGQRFQSSSDGLDSHLSNDCLGPSGLVIAKDLLLDYEETWDRLAGVEMEAGGSARAAFQAAESPGSFMVRGVSDLADRGKDTKQVKSWRPMPAVLPRHSRLHS